MIEQALKNEENEQGETDAVIEVTIGDVEPIAEFAEWIEEELPDVETTQNLVELQQRTMVVVEKIEQLEQAKSAEDCQEAVAELQWELTGLLLLMGYMNAMEIAERLVKQYDITQLKQHMMEIVQSLASPERLASRRHVPTRSTSWRKCGGRVVSMLVQTVPA